MLTAAYVQLLERRLVTPWHGSLVETKAAVKDEKCHHGSPAKNMAARCSPADHKHAGQAATGLYGSILSGSAAWMRLFRSD